MPVMTMSCRLSAQPCAAMLLLLSILLLSPLLLAIVSASSVVPDPATDCALRSLCVEYARHLQPQHGPQHGSQWAAVAADALQMWNCTGGPHWETPASQETRAAPASATRSSPSRPLSHRCLSSLPSWFVSSSNGSDESGDGSIDAPFRSVARGLEISRLWKPARHGSTARCIILREGSYYAQPASLRAQQPDGARASQLGAVLRLSAADSGLVVTSYDNEKALLSGGVLLSGLQWTLHRRAAAGDVLAAVLPEAVDVSWAAANELYVDGQRAVRAKYPNGDPSTHGRHTEPSGLLPPPAALSPARPLHPAVDLVVDSPRRNGTAFPRFQLGIGGSATAFTPPVNFWSSSNPPYGATYSVPSGLQYGADLDDRVARWTQPDTAFVHAFHGGYWGSWVFAVQSVNLVNRSILFGSGGFQEARGSRAIKEWYVSNVLEELDSPNEWFLDRQRRVLYFMANGSMPERMVLSQAPCLVSVRGEGPLLPAADITVAGLTFTETANTFMAEYEVPSGGDWAIHRGGAVFISAASAVSVVSCLFTQLGGIAVLISDWTQQVMVDGNEFSWLGDSGVALIGSSSGIDGVSNVQQPNATTVSRNLLRETGIYVKQSSPIFQALARSSRFLSNAMFNMPRAAVNINDGFAGGTEVAHNLAFNTVRETSDHGAINTWDRQPFLTARDGSQQQQQEAASLEPAYNSIHHNCLLNNYHSVYPIDHDDGSAFYLDSHNVLIYSGKKSYLGHSKHDLGELIVYPDLRVTQGPGWCLTEQDPERGSSGWDESFTNNTCVLYWQPVPYYLWYCDTHNLYVPHLSNNVFYLPPNSTGARFPCAAGSQSLNLSLSEWQAAGLDIGSSERPAPSIHEIIKWAWRLLGMHSTSSASSPLPQHSAQSQRDFVYGAVEDDL